MGTVPFESTPPAVANINLADRSPFGERLFRWGAGPAGVDWRGGGRGRAAYDGPDARAESAEQHERVRLVLADLPMRQREAVVLRFFEDMSVDETAAAMGCAAGTVKATVHQALRSLRQRLGLFV